MAHETMLIIIQVAPYASGTPYGPGPAGVHGVLPQAATALGELASIQGLEPKVIEDVRELDDTALDNARVVALFTIGETPFSDSQRAALERNWRSGQVGILGLHSSTDACFGWPTYQTLLGARFDGHPWTQSFDIDVADRNHPATAHLGAQWSWRDEVYLFRDLRPDAMILLHLTEEQVDLSVPGGRIPPSGLPLAWCHTAAGGRTFYSSLGHFPDAWERPDHLQYLLGALHWLQGEGANP
jgi:type 1 glutamine amidotransferase